MLAPIIHPKLFSGVWAILRNSTTGFVKLDSCQLRQQALRFDGEVFHFVVLGFSCSLSFGAAFSYLMAQCHMVPKINPEYLMRQQVLDAM